MSARLNSLPRRSAKSLSLMAGRLRRDRCRSDGFIVVPHLTPGGLDAFADRVVPLLQERGVFRTEYEGPTLRDHLGIAHPDDPVSARVAS